ncbi:hypothetical protein PHYSODRAFT_322020 [Phytophthora sojae]|uniref:Uncharacterized protein n=1 Tax=Phytophthora sojae (strain P6497) TaxID=1094619 RepID=G4YFC5_PHYSP|nr:hypothetical protein PHYSODRAFT_322020 [Phytophthora sojae]EGZ28351.1 hypothetical protein PHYSODRAFT_322020 [Phytophthora sojae]|eukprot:XP_009515626.1 hypothetical protein PHYSODRAFT_322020 [Phytophthora sojae]
MRAGGDDGGPCGTNRAEVATSSASSVTDRLRESLTETARLLEDFEREQQQATRQSAATPDLETYTHCCHQLVAYMVTHMQTSPGFVTQMEQVIRASFDHSALNTAVTESLWVRYNSSSQRADSGTQSPNVPQTPARQGHIIKTDTAVDNAVTVTPLAVANASVTGLRPTCSPHVDLTSTPPTVGRGGKRQSRMQEGQESKRPRHIVARNLYGAGRLDCEEKDDESGLESKKESETETETETDEQGSSQPAQTSEGSVAGLVWPCAGGDPMNRTLAYKQRLKTAIKLVDAENCSPPPGMVCTQGCERIRSRMCENHRTQGGNAMPCHNGMCCIWRDIDTHTVRCQNSQCEFKNSVGLRQTMHDIQQNELKLEATNHKLQATRVMLRGVGAGCDGDSGNSASQLESKMKKLEEKCARLEDAVVFHKERERAFRDDLRAIGGNEELQTFRSHYAKKRSRD